MTKKVMTKVDQNTIHLNIATQPLQTIAALASLIFVLNFTFEVLIAYEAAYAHLRLILLLNGILGVWAFIELWLLSRHHEINLLLQLKILLTIQIAFPVLRFVLLNLNPQDPNTDWLSSAQTQSNWHFFFLIPCSLLFLIIQRQIVELFTLNEKNRTANTETQMLLTLNALALARDNETGNHIVRTQNYVKTLALQLRTMGHYKNELTDRCIDLLFRAAPLHDLGKVGIPDHILHKPGRLTGDEWEVMKSHSLLGETILASTDIDHGSDQGVIKKGLQIAGGHHEKWDGTGYPRGLKGEEIPLAARIMALADVYDALVSERVYKAGWSHPDAVNEIETKRGSHFDPAVVDAFIAQQLTFQDIANKYRDS